MQIYITRNGQQLGPYSIDDVRSQLTKGALQSSDLAWHEGVTDWQPLHLMPEFSGVMPPAQIVKTSGLAIASLVLGLCSLLCGVFTSIPAVICGHISLSRIKESAGALTGRGMAIAGLVIGYIFIAVMVVALLAAIAIPSLMRARKTAQASACKTDIALVYCAIEQWAAEKDKRTGDTPAWSDLKPYLNETSRLGLSATCTDSLGNAITIPPVGSTPKVPAATWTALSDVQGEDLWSPYDHE